MRTSELAARNGTIYDRTTHTWAPATPLTGLGFPRIVLAPDGYKYLKMSGAAAGLVIAITHDLEIQRKPQNLLKLGA